MQPIKADRCDPISTTLRVACSLCVTYVFLFKRPRLARALLVLTHVSFLVDICLSLFSDLFLLPRPLNESQ